MQKFVDLSNRFSMRIRVRVQYLPRISLNIFSTTILYNNNTRYPGKGYNNI